MNEIIDKQITTKNLDHLGIVSAFCKELGIAEKINKRLFNQDIRKIVSPGIAVEAMILNGLGFMNRALYLTSNFFKDKPIKHLLGENLKYQDFTDDTLGKTLDLIYKYGTSKLFSEIALAMTIEHDMINFHNHIDTTTFSLEGQYKKGILEKELSGPKQIKVTYGHSKDHRPDLKQVTLSMIMNSKAELPIFMEALDGNSSDKTSFHETIANFNSFKASINIEEPFNWIADSALYSKEKLLNTNKYLWICRIPSTIQESKTLLNTDKEKITWQVIDDNYSAYSIKANYGGIKQIWVLIYSQAKYEKDLKTFLKKQKKQIENSEKKLKKIKRKDFHCEKDYIKSLKKFIKKEKYIEIEIIKEPEKEISYNLKLIEEEFKKEKNKLGRFILGTNDENNLTNKSKEILEIYKSQSKIERGFRFLKDPHFMADSFYLKKESRIEALLMIMLLSLYVYNYGQYKMRKKLAEEKITLPNQLNKETQSPTLKWVFQLLYGIGMIDLSFTKDSYVDRRTMVTNVDSIRKKIIKIMGKKAEVIYQLTTSETNTNTNTTNTKNTKNTKRIIESKIRKKLDAINNKPNGP